MTEISMTEIRHFLLPHGRQLSATLVSGVMPNRLTEQAQGFSCLSINVTGRWRGIARFIFGEQYAIECVG
jgi:hypothetical protein|tara:strand:- start:313 stop:522 length:210 start_codon:yes stop_codon:yes gene_type:complete